MKNKKFHKRKLTYYNLCGIKIYILKKNKIKMEKKNSLFPIHCEKLTRRRHPLTFDMENFHGMRNFCKLTVTHNTENERKEVYYPIYCRVFFVYCIMYDKQTRATHTKKKKEKA